MGAMAAEVVQEGCVENRQPLAASSSSLSDGSSCGGGGQAGASPPVSSSGNSISGLRRTSGPIRRAKGGWTPEEDETLRKAVETFKGRNWKKIGCAFFPLYIQYFSIIIGIRFHSYLSWHCLLYNSMLSLSQVRPSNREACLIH